MGDPRSPFERHFCQFQAGRRPRATRDRSPLPGGSEGDRGPRCFPRATAGDRWAPPTFSPAGRSTSRDIVRSLSVWPSTISHQGSPPLFVDGTSGPTSVQPPATGLWCFTTRHQGSAIKHGPAGIGVHSPASRGCPSVTDNQSFVTTPWPSRTSAWSSTSGCWTPVVGG